MKKTKLLVLSILGALTLAGCGESGVQEGELPSGGTEVDLTTEAGQAVLKERMSATEKAYSDLELASVSFTGKTSDVKAALAFAAESDAFGGAMSLNANVNGFGSKLEVKAAKHAKGANDKYDTADASVVAETTGGSLSFKGSLPGEVDATTGQVKGTAAIDTTLSLKGLSAAAYLTGNKEYVDVSNCAGFATNLDTFANKLFGQLKTSAFGSMIAGMLPTTMFDAQTESFKFASMYNEFTPKKAYVELDQAIEWPTFTAEATTTATTETEEESGLDLDLNQIATMAANYGIGFTFVTYEDNAFGFTVTVTKDSIKTIISQLAGSEATQVNAYVDKYLTKFSVEASAYFNKNYLLESAGFAFDFAAKMTSLADINPAYAQMFKSFNFEVSASGSESFELKYNNVSVSLPSASELAKYQKVESASLNVL